MVNLGGFKAVQLPKDGRGMLGDGVAGKIVDGFLSSGLVISSIPFEENDNRTSIISMIKGHIRSTDIADKISVKTRTIMEKGKNGKPQKKVDSKGNTVQDCYLINLDVARKQRKETLRELGINPKLINPK